MSDLHPIAEQFVQDAQVILAKQFDRPDMEPIVRWCSWHIDSYTKCSDERMKEFCEMQARHRANDYIELIHYVADIVQCPHPRFTNKVRQHFEEREQAHMARLEMYCKGAEKK